MTRLTIAIPSKGRLKDNAETFFRDCGFELRQAGGERGYTAALKGLPSADVLLLSAREIAQGLIEGAFHVGVTGEDLLNDLSPDLSRDACVIKKLGFGGADVVVAVPEAWIDVSTMADLEAAGALFRERHGRRLRVATKYLRLTRRFFANRSVGEYRLVESAGATEAAPASGAADLIVDITSTGATLRANHLKVLDDGVILQSEAALVGSLKAPWNEDLMSVLRTLLDSIDARLRAEQTRILRTTHPIRVDLARDLGLETIKSTNDAQISKNEASNAARRLAEAGVGPVAILKPEYIFRADNPLFDLFFESFSRRP